ncbi:hypothetical protein BDK51DRAFT_39629 [Blyttiomyces helicus]|uniref:SHSP domain-containing protein n=1 Tax=Blyttiomyces helicus TaxID=388810 RepID=A0A4P9WCK8_9FUNG|nr:hypothetical protein BDK51DRAFT_39629 [Blyttiomyces helicus]|eukprot:RKO90399.1 hypothetical protein BDK51DRAFT_39629 [Blyttiomyces helicus]
MLTAPPPHSPSSPAKPQDGLDIFMHNSLLTISGDRKPEPLDSTDQRRVTERYHGCFRRQIRIPSDVVLAKVTGTLRKGVLEIKLPKAKFDVPEERRFFPHSGRILPADKRNSAHMSCAEGEEQRTRKMSTGNVYVQRRSTSLHPLRIRCTSSRPAIVARSLAISPAPVGRSAFTNERHLPRHRPPRQASSPRHPSSQSTSAAYPLAVYSGHILDHQFTVPLERFCSEDGLHIDKTGVCSERSRREIPAALRRTGITERREDNAEANSRLERSGESENGRFDGAIKTGQNHRLWDERYDILSGSHLGTISVPPPSKWLKRSNSLLSEGPSRHVYGVLGRGWGVGLLSCLKVLPHSPWLRSWLVASPSQVFPLSGQTTELAHAPPSTPPPMPRCLQLTSEFGSPYASLSPTLVLTRFRLLSPHHQQQQQQHHRHHQHHHHHDHDRNYDHDPSASVSTTTSTSTSTSKSTSTSTSTYASTYASTSTISPSTSTYARP